MSYTYATAPNRVRLVTNWFELGQGVLHQARMRRGLSREAVARQIGVSAKTYERWEKRGAVPMHLADRVAEVIGLKIESQSTPVVVQFPSDAVGYPARPEQVEALHNLVREQMGLVETMPGHLENIDDQLEGIHATLVAIEQRLEALDAQLKRPAAGERH